MQILAKGRVTCPKCKSVGRKTVDGLKKHLETCKLVHAIVTMFIKISLKLFISTCLSSEHDFVESVYMSTLWETTENFNWNEVPPHG